MINTWVVILTPWSCNCLSSIVHSKDLCFQVLSLSSLIPIEEAEGHGWFHWGSLSTVILIQLTSSDVIVWASHSDHSSTNHSKSKSCLTSFLSEAYISGIGDVVNKRTTAATWKANFLWLFQIYALGSFGIHPSDFGSKAICSGLQNIWMVSCDEDFVYI